MKVKLTCPLGHTCERVVAGINGEEDYIERCRWYRKYASWDKERGTVMEETVHWDCAIPKNNELQIEALAGLGGIQAAVESRGNATHRSLDALVQLAAQPPKLVRYLGED